MRAGPLLTFTTMSAHAHSTLPSFERKTDGSTARPCIECVPKEDEMTQTIQEKNKAFVLKAFETLFNQRDYAAAERFWSPSYIQHSAHIAPGRDGLFDLIRSLPASLRYENQLIVA